MTTVKLKTPVTHAGTTYTELSFRKAKTGDLMVADKFEGETSKMVAILAAMADIPLPAFREIELDDFNSIVTEVADLMGESLKSTATGSTS